MGKIARRSSPLPQFIAGGQDMGSRGRKTAVPPTPAASVGLFRRPAFLWGAAVVAAVSCFVLVLDRWNRRESPTGAREGPFPLDAAEATRQRAGSDGVASDGTAVPAAVRAVVTEALQTVGRLRQRFPDDRRAAHVAAELRYRLGQSDQALQLWRECAERDTQDAEAFVAIGRIHLESGAYADSERALCAALAASPGDLQAACLLANALVHQGKLQAAVDILEPSVVADPSLMAGQMLLGQTYLQRKQDARAKACFLAVTRLAPDYANAYHGLATACARLGEKDEATRHRERLRDLQLKELRQRIDDTERYNDLASTQQIVAQALVSAGRVYADHGVQREAKICWQRAAELDPRHTDGGP